MFELSALSGVFFQVQYFVTFSHSCTADEPNFQIQCNFQGCTQAYKKFTVYRNHIYQYHNASRLDNLAGEESVNSLSNEDKRRYSDNRCTNKSRSIENDMCKVDIKSC